MEPDVGQHSAALRGAIVAMIGGLIGWIAAFSGLGLWGLAIGLALTVIVILALARRSRATAPLGVMAAYTFAFVLLTWPLLWLLVGRLGCGSAIRSCLRCAARDGKTP